MQSFCIMILRSLIIDQRLICKERNPRELINRKLIRTELSSCQRNHFHIHDGSFTVQYRNYLIRILKNSNPERKFVQINIKRNSEQEDTIHGFIQLYENSWLKLNSKPDSLFQCFCASYSKLNPKFNKLHIINSMTKQKRHFLILHNPIKHNST